MKITVFLAFCVSICMGATVAPESKSKSSSMSTKINSIPSPTQKPTMFFQHAQVIPVQIVPRPIYPFGGQPHAMLIIAQPAMVPQHLVYPSQPQIQPQQSQNYAQQQQLLNYFHSNPAAKYQFLYGLPQSFSPSPSHQSSGSPSLNSYQMIPNSNILGTSSPINFNPFTHLSPVSSQLTLSNPTHSSSSSASSNNAQQYASPLQLSQLQQLSAYATLTGQQYSPTTPQHYQASPPPQYQIPMRTVAPIITGLENFTPEQQAQIKAQLGAHLSGQVTAPLSTPTSIQATRDSSQDYDSQEEKGAVQGADTKYSPTVSYKPQYNSQQYTSAKG